MTGFCLVVIDRAYLPFGMVKDPHNQACWGVTFCRRQGDLSAHSHAHTYANATIREVRTAGSLENEVQGRLQIKSVEGLYLMIQCWSGHTDRQLERNCYTPGQPAA